MNYVGRLAGAVGAEQAEPCQSTSNLPLTPVSHEPPPASVEQLERRLPKVATMLEDAEPDMLAFYAFPAEHWPQDPLDG